MIIDAFIFIVTNLLSVVLALFPTSTGLPTEFSNALTTLSGYVGILDPLVPIATLAQCLSIILLYEATLLSFKGTAWLYHKIPFIGK